MNKLLIGDCTQVLRTLKDGVVDLTVTSPPYDSMRSYTGEKTFNWEVFCEVAEQLYRLTSEGGVVVWNVNDQTKDGAKSATSFKQVLKFLEVGFILADTMIWEKPATTLGSNRLYHANFEFVFILSKGKHRTFNPIKDRKNFVAGRIQLGRGHVVLDGKSKVSSRVTQTAEFGKRNNIWRLAPVQGSKKLGHSAPFPFDFAKDHILSWSNEGDVVLDPFMGSGTVACAAICLQRKWIGVEVSEEYAAIANKRIASFQGLL